VNDRTIEIEVMISAKMKFARHGTGTPSIGRNTACAAMLIPNPTMMLMMLSSTDIHLDCFISRPQTC